MQPEQQLHWIRHFYRARLARYLKKLYLAGWQTWVRVRAFLVWHISLALSRRLPRLKHAARNHPIALARLAASVAAGAVSRLQMLMYRITGQRAVWYQMRPFSVLKTDGASYQELVPARLYPTPMPEVQPAQYARYFPDGDYPLPVAAIGVLEISDAQVLSKSDFIFTRDVCLHHDLYRFGRDFLFEEMHSVVSINAKSDMLVRFKGDHVHSIPQGISLVGSTTSNYIHWLTEALPKLALIDQIDAYAELPYLIDSGLHPNILESIRLLNSRRRQLIEVGPSELLAVEKLLCVTPTAYVPFDFQPGLAADQLDINPSSAMYSPDALQRLRQLLVAALVHAPVAPRKKLYLRRSGRSRPMENSDAVEALMLEQGFSIVEPETLSFSDQVRLFSDAGVIVGQGGAALGNIIFAPAACHLVVLTTWSPYTIHYYFANLAAALGQTCTLIMCEPVHSELEEHRAHMGVNVPIATLLKAIQ